MARNTIYLRRKLLVSEFYHLSQQVAMDYAKSGYSIARTVLTERYNITESAFYTLLEFSITHHLVTDEIVDDIREKILENQNAHGNHGFNSNIKYDNLVYTRKNYSAFSKKDIAYITEYYANHPEYSKEKVARIFHFYDKKVLNHIFKRACIELIISDKTFELLCKRAIEGATDKSSTVLFFEKLSHARSEAKKRNQKNSLSTF